MAIRNALPFEFPYRWPDLRRFFGKVPDEAADFLDQRDRDLEDYLADLNDGIGAAEHFRYIVNDYRTTATTAVNEVVALSSAASGAFASAGVSLASNVVTLPVGKWMLGLTIETTYWSAQPTFGDFHIGFDILTPYHPYVASLDHQEYDWTGNAPTFCGSNIYDITDSDQTITVIHYTDSGVTSTLYGMVWGHQIA